MKYYRIINYVNGRSRIEIIKDGKITESMSSAVILNPDAYRCKYGTINWKKKLKQLEGLKEREIDYGKKYWKS